MSWRAEGVYVRDEEHVAVAEAHWWGREGFKEACKRAVLLAAAPELLAMLEKFADDDAGRIERDEAKALIARVKGTP